MLENTLINKSKFFAQYWGQHICSSNILKGNEYTIKSVLLDWDKRSNDWYLNLTPLELISDEDAIEVCELHYGIGTVQEFSKERYIKNVRKYVLFNAGFVAVKIADWLRAKGYALPFMGLSVEQLVSYGWVKLK